MQSMFATLLNFAGIVLGAIAAVVISKPEAPGIVVLVFLMLIEAACLRKALQLYIRITRKDSNL